MFGLSIRSLLIGLFALMALIVGGEGILAVNKISAVHASVVEMATNWLPSISAVRQMNTLAERGRTYVARHVFHAADDAMKAEEETIAKTSEAFAAARKNFESMIVTGEERKTYEMFLQRWAMYQPILVDVLKLSRAGKKKEAGELFAGAMSKEFTGIRNLMLRLVELNEKGANEAAEASYDVARAITFVALGIGLAIAIGAMAFSFLGIARPISGITASMGVLANGDMSGAIPFAARRDEIGRMAAAVQVFKDNMIRARARS